MNHQYSVAVHVLSLLNLNPAFSSEELAGSVGVHPVVVRTVTGLLRQGGLLTTSRGVPGAQLTRRPDQITLLDIYRAVNAPESVLKLHPRPNPACPVGAHIQSVLETSFGHAQSALEASLATTTLADVIQALQARAG